MDLSARGDLGPRGTGEYVSVLTPKEKPKKEGPRMVPFRGAKDLIAEIDKAAGELNLSRNEAMTQLLRYALDAHRKEQAKRK